MTDFIPIHDLSSDSNCEMFWCPGDSEETYQQNLLCPDKKHLLETLGWHDKKISYNLNSHGFRTKEFIDQPNFITLGCSFTFGAGMLQTDIWPELLSSKLGLACYNLGVPGSALDTCYRLARYYIPRLRPKLVVVLEPEAIRLELHNNNGPTVFNPYNEDMFTESVWMKTWVADENNARLHAEKNLDAIGYICNCNNADFYVIRDDFFLEFFSKYGENLARDLQHPGYDFHLNFSDYVYQLISDSAIYKIKQGN